MHVIERSTSVCRELTCQMSTLVEIVSGLEFRLGYL